MSCYSKYGNQPAANILDRDGAWHHVAVTWTAANNGLTKVYKDGLLRAEVSALQVLLSAVPMRQIMLSADTIDPALMGFLSARCILRNC